MAIEIRELHIKAVVGTDPDQQRGTEGGAQMTEQERELLVALCVERVMEVIARQKER
jgi:hypothetical protein